MTRNYPKLGIEEFGRHLLDTGDLDPIYLAANEAMSDEAQMKRFLLAYWCLYHAGSCCYISEREGSGFWEALLDASGQLVRNPATGELWPRGHERRHWRGDKALKAAQAMRAIGREPEDLVDWLVFEDGAPFAEVNKRVQTLPLFGPWIAFKVGDMAERCLGVQIDFTRAEVFMFKTPLEAAMLLWRTQLGLPENAKPKDLGKTLEQVVEHVSGLFPDDRAPPSFDRPLGLQEIETILCKWKSHLGGSYPLFNDQIDIAKGMKPWANISETAERFDRHIPRPF